MKKAIFGIAILTLLFTTSCKKSMPSNYWAFKGTTYTVAACTGQGNILSASNMVSSTINGNSTLSITFTGATLPDSNGAYPVVGGYTAPAGPQAYLVLDIYGAQGGHSLYSPLAGQTIAVTVSSTGKVSVSGSGIQMVNIDNSSDISALSLNITQTQ